jgi:hypothetical protein
MDKKIVLFLVLMMLIAAACSQIEKKTCTDFKDCLPKSIDPGQTGCGGCYTEGESEICYELNEVLCDSYKQNYSCVNGFCN